MKKIVSMLVISLLMLSTIFAIPLIRATATISTDKADYSPTETVTIYGSGFDPTATVTITVTRPDGSTNQWTLTPDSSGSFTTSYLLDGILGLYTVDATDGTNAASTTFTDKAIFSDLYGYTLLPSEGWTKGDVKGYYEDDWVPYMIEITSSKDDSYQLTVTIRHDYYDGTYYALDDVGNWQMSRNGDPETPTHSGLTVVGSELEWTWTFTINKDDDCILKVKAHIAIGAHNWPGAKIHTRIYDITSDPHTTINEGNKDVSLMTKELEPVPTEATISGVKYDDSNANGIRNIGEVGLQDWTIKLWKDSSFVTSTTTGVAGDYIFTVSEAGHYKVTEVLQDGWMQTAPTSGYHEFDVAPGDVIYDKDFGNIMLGSISGVKFDDSNANGVWDNTEVAVKGWEVELTGTNVRGDVIDVHAFTGADGKFIFEGLLPGTYTVTEIFPLPPPKWAATTATSFAHVLTEGEDYTGPDFGNIRLGSISGAKFYDADIDGVWDLGEVPIAGWKVHLTGTDVRGISIDLYAFTDSIGKFVFSNLYPGTYTVTEVFPPQPPIYIATTSTSFAHVLTEGEDYTGLSFGNVCVKPGTGGLTLGFWSNKNGQSLITASDVTALNALNLFTPTGWTYPPFSTIALNTAKTQIKNYLLSATAVDMRWMLSAQLIATKLDVLHGFLTASTMVYVGISTYVLTGFISIGEIINNAKAALLKPHPAFRAEQEYWKNLLDGLNNNRLPFVCPAPCPFNYT